MPMGKEQHVQRVKCSGVGGSGGTLEQGTVSMQGKSECKGPEARSPL